MIACLIFFNDQPELLERCFKSLKKTHLPIIAIDGPFKDFPHDTVESTNGCVELAKQYADCFIPGKEYLNQIEKRNAYMKLANKQYVFVIDADEEVIIWNIDNITYSKPLYTVDIETNGFREPHFRIQSGLLRYTDKHYLAKPEIKDHKIVSPRTETVIKHYIDDRNFDRRMQKKAYYAARSYK